MGTAWRLTGRAEELRAIAGVFSENREHVGVVIAGNPGIGKTRLAREAAAVAADTGWAVRWVVGTVTAQSIPLGSFAQWADGDDGNSLRLVRQVISSMTSVAGGERVLVAVDDAHLLDDLSAFVLHQMVLQGVASVLATIRSGEPAPAAVTALWKEGHLRRLELQPLSRAESDALLEAALGRPVNSECSQRLWRFTRGNVLFLRQLVDQELSGGRLININGRWRWIGKIAVSPSLIDLVDMQIGAVSERVRDVVDLVAVAEPLERVWLASLVEPDVIEEAERRGLIAVSAISGGDVVRVAHPLYGQVRLQQCGPLRLRRLRGRVAAVMAKLNSADPLRLALLWLDSDLEPDGNLYLRAAQTALALLDLELTERMAAAATGAGAGAEADILRAHALVLLNRGQQAQQVLDSLAGRDVSEPYLSSQLHLRAANFLWPLGRPEDSWNVIERALAQCPDDRGNSLRAFRSVQLAMAARPAEVSSALDSLDRSKLAVLPTLVAIWAEVIALGDLGYPERAAAAAAAGLELACSSTEAIYEGIGLTEFHVSALLLGGCIPHAVAAAQYTYGKFVNLPGLARSVTTAVSGIAALGASDLPTALRCLRSAVADLEARSDTTGILYRFAIAYTQSLARSGDIDGALNWMRRMETAAHPSCVFVESDRLLSSAWVAAARGRTTEAREIASAAADFAASHGQHAREVMCLQTAVQFGETKIATRLEELAHHVRMPRAPLAARYARALANGDGDELRIVSSDFEELGDRFAAADAAAHASVAYGRQHRRGAALNAGGRARRIMADCGGAVSPAVLAAQSPLPLSAREREIGTMVAQGLTNKEIARALTMSVRTVEGHIYRVTSRLGVANRAELSSLMRECGDVPAESHTDVLLSPAEF